MAKAATPMRAGTPTRQLRWQAYERFQQELLSSNIRPGQFVSQRELAALTGLPLGAIREVIPRLEAEGLLVTVPQRGLQIANVDVKLVRNAFQLRLALEKEAAAQFATSATDAQLAALGNEIVSAIYRVNSLRIRLIRLGQVTLNAEALRPAMNDHLTLLAALRTRDPRQATAAIEAHLTHARNRALGL